MPRDAGTQPPEGVVPISIVNGYATLDEFKARLEKAPATTDDSMLENVVTSVSRWIDQYCQRHFWQTAANTVRVFDTCDSYDLRLGAYNELASASITLRTDENVDGVFETTWAGSDFQLLPRNVSAAPEQRPYREIRAVGSRTFPKRSRTDREGLIEITGTWGWPAVPLAVREACLLQATRIWKRRYSPEGIAGYSEFGIVRVSGKLDTNVAEMLDPYRRTAVLVA